MPEKNKPEGEIGPFLTTSQGIPVSDDHDSLKIGTRGPTLLEDFILRERITHFDHERIPERVVHARGSAAFGVFRPYKSMSKYTKAHFLSDPAEETPVFVRFSTVVGSRGSADTVRDVRGFATKFYTKEGNYDLVGNNIPVFFIQDAMKFPDLVHAIKPEPDSEIPQASSAHDTFWDFASLMPESLHMLFWLMSDRALPRSFRMMEGFGVHTFRFLNHAGEGHFVKFHFRPLLGTHALLWDEAQELAGRDPDFHRRDLWESIERGDFPEWELGVQIIPESEEFSFGFDLLDATKLVPEELVPIVRIGKMTLNRNPDNFFVEVEQAAFCPGNLVPGIDVTGDPLLQGRLFSYIDTQLIRLGGPNFTQLPTNRPHVEVHSNQRDGYHQRAVDKGRVSYSPNSLGGGCPFQTPERLAGFVSRAESVEGHKLRARSSRFADFSSQARLFYRSQTAIEQEHIASAFEFELGKVKEAAVRSRMVDLIAQVDRALAARIAQAVGVKLSETLEVPWSAADPEHPLVPPNSGTPIARTDEPAGISERRALPDVSPSLSMMYGPRSAKGKRVAVLVAPGVDGKGVAALRAALLAAGALGELVSPQLGTLQRPGEPTLSIDRRLGSTSSVEFDAVFVPSGADSVAALSGDADALRFIAQAYFHYKTIGAHGDGVMLLKKAGILPTTAQEETGKPDEGMIIGQVISTVAHAFVVALAASRHFARASMRAERTSAT